MQVVGCGFTGAPYNLLSSFEARWTSVAELSDDYRIASGGWGCFAVLKSGAVQLQHGQLKVCKLSIAFTCAQSTLELV